MTEQRQHTLLTRFVPFEPGDPDLRMTLDGLLADAMAIFRDAATMLRP
ncbi:hypothetical protein [Dactylosporangium sp. CA-233914]